MFLTHTCSDRQNTSSYHKTWSPNTRVSIQLQNKLHCPKTNKMREKYYTGDYYFALYLSTLCYVSTHFTSFIFFCSFFFFFSSFFSCLLFIAFLLLFVSFFLCILYYFLLFWSNICIRVLYLLPFILLLKGYHQSVEDRIRVLTLLLQVSLQGSL